jgi:hypothetical protein
MKKQSRKLNLNRETLHSLQSDDLRNVNGGDVTLPPTETLTSLTRTTHTSTSRTSVIPTLDMCPGPVTRRALSLSR